MVLRVGRVAVISDEVNDVGCVIVAMVIGGGFVVVVVVVVDEVIPLVVDVVTGEGVADCSGSWSHG